MTVLEDQDRLGRHGLSRLPVPTTRWFGGHQPRDYWSASVETPGPDLPGFELPPRWRDAELAASTQSKCILDRDGPEHFLSKVWALE